MTPPSSPHCRLRAAVEEWADREISGELPKKWEKFADELEKFIYNL